MSQDKVLVRAKKPWPFSPEGSRTFVLKEGAETLVDKDLAVDGVTTGHIEIVKKAEEPKPEPTKPVASPENKADAPAENKGKKAKKD